MQDWQFQVLHEHAILGLEFIVPFHLHRAALGVVDDFPRCEECVVGRFGIMRLGKIPVAHAESADDRWAKEGDEPRAVGVHVEHGARGDDAPKNAPAGRFGVDMDRQRIDILGKGNDLSFAVAHDAERDGHAYSD